MDRTVLQAILDHDFSSPAAVCSQLGWKGSVPRKDYPVMLVPETGRPIGTVGGGGLEHAVIESARESMAAGEVRFEQHRLDQPDADAPGGICGGQSQMLIEPLTPEIQAFWQSVQTAEQAGEPLIVITRVSAQDGWTVDRRQAPDQLPEGTPAAVDKAWTVARNEGRSRSLDTSAGFYLVQCLPRQPVLHLFGAGHVSHAVAQMAHFIALDIIVYDDRLELANPQRFPNARSIITTDTVAAAGAIALDPGDLILVLARGHKLDLGLLEVLLNREWRYLGLISSKVKWRLVAEKLLAAGVSAERIAEVHAPVGLAIQSETVPEIAVSIIAEIIHQLHTTGRSELSLARRRPQRANK